MILIEHQFWFYKHHESPHFLQCDPIGPDAVSIPIPQGSIGFGKQLPGIVEKSSRIGF